MGKRLELAGQKFGRLTVRDYYERRHGRIFWKCICECGNEICSTVAPLRNGHTKSCGCSRYEKVTIHGMEGTPTYRSWRAMLDRCTNQNNARYKDYGGRGVIVCSRWFNFVNFHEDMGERPKDKTLDRKDNNGNYCKGNCKWSSLIEQGNNKRNNHIITFDEKTLTLQQWADKLGMHSKTLSARIIDLKWSIERALTTKVY